MVHTVLFKCITRQQQTVEDFIEPPEVARGQPSIKRYLSASVVNTTNIRCELIQQSILDLVLRIKVLTADRFQLCKLVLFIAANVVKP